ncbi:uncharacterized protein LOC135080270 [Ostrinia nubilalis]|uniref:uncharacterized protein LOC135080270 n=1 Tax=Ostrinia nubilalis TaxID=29057 RepID=UPI003082672C
MACEKENIMVDLRTAQRRIQELVLQTDACEKENIMVDLRTAQRRIQELVLQLDEVRKINPDVFWTATTSRNPQPTAPSAPSSRQAGSRPTSSTSRPGTTGRPAGSAGTTRPAGNGATKKTGIKKKKISEEESMEMDKEGTPPPLRFDCPVCDKPFKTLVLLQQHVDSCLL